MRHLDAGSFSQLLRAPGASPELLEHLASGCEVCDAFLASQPELDGDLDRLLLSLAPPAARPLDEVGWRRLRARLRTRRPVGLMVGLAASLAVLAGAALVVRASVPGTEDPGRKGGEAALEVVAARQLPSGTFEQVGSPARVPAGSTLAFQLTSPIDGPARVFLQRGPSVPEELAQLRVQAGTSQLENEQGLFGVALEEERGAVTFWFVVGAAPFDSAAALDAIRTRLPPLVVGRLEVQVEP